MCVYVHRWFFLLLIGNYFLNVNVVNVQMLWNSCLFLSRSSSPYRYFLISYLISIILRNNNFPFVSFKVSINSNWLHVQWFEKFSFIIRSFSSSGSAFDLKIQAWSSHWCAYAAIEQSSTLTCTKQYFLESRWESFLVF